MKITAYCTYRASLLRFPNRANVQRIYSTRVTEISRQLLSRSRSRSFIDHRLAPFPGKQIWNESCRRRDRRIPIRGAITAPLYTSSNLERNDGQQTRHALLLGGELVIKFCRGKIIPSSKISWTSNLSFSLPWEEASWKELSTGVAFDSRRRFPPPIKTSLAHNLALCRVIQPHPERNHRAATPQHEKRGRGATINANSLDIGTMPAVVPSFINPRTSRATTQSTECNRDFASLKREREKKRKGTTSRLELDLELCSR